MDEKEPRKLMSAKECASFTGYKVSTIYVLAHNKQIPYYKNRGRILFDRDEIEAWQKKEQHLAK